MLNKTLRIATRKSMLALAQAEYVGERLQHANPGLQVELLKIVTQGDKILDSPLAKVGGKGLFIKALEQALLDNRADIAVHSMKDVPADLPEGLHIATICAREDPRDAFVSNSFKQFEKLPKGARIGTSSLRRQCQLSALRPDFDIVDLRGNINTRLKKLDAEEYDAIILAVAGLKRLGLSERICEYLSPEISLPAVGQGAIGMECRSDDLEVHDLIRPLNDTLTHICVTAERAMNHRLQGGCQIPIAGYGQISRAMFRLRGLVGTPDGKRIIRGEINGDPESARELGVKLADDLLAQGAGKILETLYSDP